MVALDCIKQPINIVDVEKGHSPQLQIVVQATDVTRRSQLRDRSVMRVQRELFEPSLKSARSVLELLGQTPDQARQSAQRFRQYNLAFFEQLYPHYQDRAKVIADSEKGRAQFKAQMTRAREQLAQEQSVSKQDGAEDTVPNGEVGEKPELT